MKEKIIDFFTFRRPIGRLKYFLITLAVGVITIFTSLLIKILGSIFVNDLFAIISFFFIILCFLLNIYISFLAMLKRFWDIFGEKYIGVILLILWVLFVGLLLMYSGPQDISYKILSLIYSVMLFFIKGRNADDDKEISTQAEGDSQEG